MVKRPWRSVRAVRLTLPLSVVAVTVAFSMASLSGPVTRPRMTSTFWADAPDATQQKAATSAARSVFMISTYARDCRKASLSKVPDWTYGPDKWFPARTEKLSGEHPLTQRAEL